MWQLNVNKRMFVRSLRLSGVALLGKVSPDIMEDDIEEILKLVNVPAPGDQQDATWHCRNWTWEAMEVSTLDDLERASFNNNRSFFLLCSFWQTKTSFLKFLVLPKHVEHGFQLCPGEDSFKQWICEGKRKAAYMRYVPQRNPQRNRAF